MKDAQTHHTPSMRNQLDGVLDSYHVMASWGGEGEGSFEVHSNRVSN